MCKIAVAVHQHRHQVLGHHPADCGALLAALPDLLPVIKDFFLRALTDQAGVPLGQGRSKGYFLGKPPEGFLHQQRHLLPGNRTMFFYDVTHLFGQGRINLRQPLEGLADVIHQTCP